MNLRLVDAVRGQARIGDFTLASGAKSNLYVDLRPLSLHSPTVRLIAEEITQRLLDVSEDVVGIGGPELGAVPILGAVLAINASLHGFIVRKERKGHGTGRLIEGLDGLPQGAPVWVIEDVTTTGGSMLKAVGAAQEAGLVVVRCVTVFDREEGARAAIEARGIPFNPLVTRSGIGL